MAPPTDNGASPAPIDRPIVEYLRDHLAATGQVEEAVITDDEGHLELRVSFDPAYYPSTANATLSVRWYTNDDFTIHYREAENEWEQRWDRHPNPHNSRDHLHPPPDALTPGEDASWPNDHRDVLSFVLDRIEERIETLWNG